MDPSNVLSVASFHLLLYLILCLSVCLSIYLLLYIYLSIYLPATYLNTPRDTFQRLMREGGPMAVLPGGFEEATITCDNKHRIYIKKRMGFVKYALQAGYSIVPSCK